MDLEPSTYAVQYKRLNHHIGDERNKECGAQDVTSRDNRLGIRNASDSRPPKGDCEKAGWDGYGTSINAHNSEAEHFHHSRSISCQPDAIGERPTCLPTRLWP